MGKSRYAIWWVLCSALLAWPWQTALASGWTATVNGDAGFNTPTAYANLHTVDFSAVTLAAEQTAGRLTYSSALASSSSITYTDANSGGLTGMSGNDARITASASNASFSTLTINFPGGGTSYVAFLWGLSIKIANAQYVTFTFSDASTVTLYNCSTVGNATCIGNYVAGNWLSNFLGALLGGNSYDTAYITYTPASNVTITKIEFFDSRCTSCGFLGFSSLDQYLYVDNLSYVDATVAPDHIEVTAPSSSITAGASTTFTFRSCANASCSSLYTTGLTGTFALTGAGMTPSYPSGQTYTIPARSSSGTLNASITPGGTATVALSAPSKTPTASPSVWCGMGVAAASGNSCALTVVGLDHLALTTTVSGASAGAAVTYTITACANASCSSLYTNGVNGTLSITGVTPIYAPAAAFSIGSGSSSATVSVTMTTGTAAGAITGISVTPSNSPTVFCGMGVAAASGNSCNLTVAAGLHHVELTTTSSTGVTCNPITYTLKACSDAACSVIYTGGVAGTLTVSGGGVTVNPATQLFTIPAGGTVTATAQATTAGTVTAALSLMLPLPSSGTYCGMGVAASSGGSCNFTTSTSGLLFNVPDHVADVAQSVTVTAIQSSNNAAVCTPGFASVSKSVLFKCTYTNPSTGSKPVIVGGAALNATNSTAAACDGTGRSVSLAFNASGVATTTVQYADVGQMGLTAAYTGSGTDAGLIMNGSDSFIAAPYDFGVSITTGGNLTAASNFNGTVTARNASGTATPNFGKETVAEGATLGFVRVKPSGSSAVNGSFTGSVGAFSAGAANSTNLNWTEVGRGDVTAVLASGSYLSSGFKVAGSTGGSWTSCAAEAGTCTLPTGATAMIAFGASGRYNFLAGQTGSVACTTGVFGDPIVGTVKNCYYIATSATNTAATGNTGPFVPHHFNVTRTNACGPAFTFTYSGQPFAVTTTAVNASGATTQNYDGTVNTSPNFAKAVTLSAVTNGGTGALTNTAVAASSFTLGVAAISASPTSPTFTFTSKLTAPTSVSLRAIDTDSVSSSGYTENSVDLRSGRLKFSNAFGSEKSSLVIPVQAQYWSNKAWVLNSLDTCTVVPAAAIALSSYLDYKGAATAAWTTTASAVTISTGTGNLTLTAPSPTATGSLDLAFNLGSTAADNACVSAHAVTTGAGLSYLRSLNGNCAATYDRDPSARVTFGVYSPETTKTIHVRELF